MFVKTGKCLWLNDVCGCMSTVRGSRTMQRLGIEIRRSWSVQVWTPLWRVTRSMVSGSNGRRLLDELLAVRRVVNPLQ